MRSYALRNSLPLLLALLPLFLGQPARGTVPVPEPDPARLAAARTLVRTLPIQDSLAYPFSGNPVRDRVIRAVIDSAAHPPSSPEIATFARAHVNRRIDEVLPEVLPAVTEETARAYALLLRLNELNAATSFFGAPDGRSFAFRTVSQDPQIIDALYRHLLHRIAPEANQILAAAADAERLRQEVNARAGR
jgi:hypothetical protein